MKAVLGRLSAASFVGALALFAVVLATVAPDLAWGAWFYLGSTEATRPSLPVPWPGLLAPLAIGAAALVAELLTRRAWLLALSHVACTAGLVRGVVHLLALVEAGRPFDLPRPGP